MIPPQSIPGKGPIDVTRLRFPLLLTISLISLVVTGMLSVGAVWFKAQAHAENKVIHLDEHDAVMGGGPSYKNDLSTLRNDLRWQLLKFREDLAKAEITCIKNGPSGLLCTFRMPDTTD